MPLIIPKDLIGEEVLKQEKIFIMDQERAKKQDIRPIRIAIVNLMPKKEETEVQILRMLTNTALQIKIDLVRMNSYHGKNTSAAHLEKFYKTYDEIKNNKYDAMIITGAPVEKLQYEEIKYWDELKIIFDFAETNVFSTMFICWSAQAALNYYYGIESHKSKEKIFGVYDFDILGDSKLLRGFDDEFSVPHSRHTYVKAEDILKEEDIKLLAAREETGVALASTCDNRFVFSFGHWEYDKETLQGEYLRDISQGLPIKPPLNYYVDNDPNKEIKVKWRSAGNLFFSNWLNYCVYQETPFYLKDIQKKKVSKFGGSSLSDSKQFSKVKDIILSKEDSDVIIVSAPGKRNGQDRKVTDDLIEIANLQKDLKELEIIEKRLKKEEEYKKKQVSFYRETIKKRFEDLALELNLEDEFQEDMEETFKEIQESNSLDFIVSRGEYLNAKLMAHYLDYEFVDAKDLIFFDEQGEIDSEKSVREIRNRIEKGKKVVVPGFYGVDQEGQIKTFSRGGSDYTGSIIASALNSKVYENWTDVNGIMTSDPNKDKNAKTISHLNYEELSQIIEDGAQVYQKDAIEPVKNKNITIRILNTNNPNFEGTEISNLEE